MNVIFFVIFVRHFLVFSETCENKNREKKAIFANYLQIIRENSENSRFSRFSRVRKCSKSSEITEIFPKFEKRQFPKLAKTKILEKNV